MIIPHFQFDIFTYAPTIHLRYISNQNLEVVNWPNIVMDFLSKVPLNKVMGDSIVYQDDYLVVFDISLNFQGLKGGNAC